MLEIRLSGTPEEIREEAKKLFEILSRVPAKTKPIEMEQQITLEEVKPKAPKAPDISLEDVRAKCAKLMTEGKKVECQEILHSVGAKRMSDLKPDDLPVVMSALEQLEVSA